MDEPAPKEEEERSQEPLQTVPFNEMITDKPDGLATRPEATPPPPVMQSNEEVRMNRSLIASLASSVESVGTPTISTGEEMPFSMNPDDYTIGFGSSAIVYHTTYVPLNMTVAVKMIDLDHFERNQIDELRKEIQVMTLCKHPNLLRILASFVHESKLWIVTPFLRGGSCLDIMKTGFRDGLDEASIATILLQALQGLDYLHRDGHIHRDVKAGNLLMDVDGMVQLADFGVSSSLMEDLERRGLRKTFVGTPCWMAPEVMEMTRGYDTKADIWSFGITALELAYGHAPFSKYPPMKVIYLTLSSAPPSLDRKRGIPPNGITQAIIMCRPTAEMLLKHPFFKAAKKKSHLANAILAVIPPLEQRPRVTKLVKQLADNAATDTSETTRQEWDFSESETETEAGIGGAGTEPSTAPNSPEATDEGTVRTIGDKRCSRFVVEAEPRSEDPSSRSSPTEEKGVVSPLDLVDGMEGDDAGGVRKGRFSVLESARDNPSSPMDVPIVESIIEGELEEGRRSRFKVEIPVIPPDEVVNGVPSRFHVSQPQPARMAHESVDSLPAPYPRGPSYPLYEEVNANGETPTTSAPYGRDYGQSALIFVHPSQFDQLLLLNELIRQQLLELRNSTRRNDSFYGSASYHPTIHYNGFSEWEGRPMVEDPQVTLPPNLSAYSPAEPWDPRKRRSMSIDQRGIRPLGSAGVHRTVHSIKSPQPDGVELMRRELEMLRRENEVLRKK